MLTLDFPADEIMPVTAYPEISLQFAGSTEIWKGKSDYLVVFRSQKEIEAINPDFRLLKKIEARGIIVTAPGNSCDFVSRFFAPQVGVDEDPVTGSAHTTLTVYWSERLHKMELSAQQLSRRKGELYCKFSGDRIEISGQCKTYLIGEIHLNE
jgi:PhzF family phenazine biosynthesis protein